MKSVFVKLFLLRKYICIFLFCSFYPAMVAADRGGFLYLRFLCYQNPGNKLPSGEICESGTSKVCWQYFKICISSQYIKGEIETKMCDVHHRKTYTYGNEDLVCNNLHGSKTYLELEIKKELLLPLYETYFVKIEVRNGPGRNNQLIASFGAEFSQIPSDDLSKVVYKDVRMQRSDLGYSNAEVSLDISLGLQCDHGKYCLDSCKPNSQNIKSCTKDGKRICQKGWEGEKCDTKDLCSFESCIESGQCLEIKGKAECWCNNQTGPHCYSNYNPCSKNPCKNEGICSPKKVGEMRYDCQCKHPFFGPQCLNNFDICESEPCKNNASCYRTKPGAFICKCHHGFQGEFCEQNIDANSSDRDLRIHAFYICSVFVVIFVIVLVIVLTKHFITKPQEPRNAVNPMIEIRCETTPLIQQAVADQDVKVNIKTCDKMGESNSSHSSKVQRGEHPMPSHVIKISPSKSQFHKSV